VVDDLRCVDPVRRGGRRRRAAGAGRRAVLHRAELEERLTVEAREMTRVLLQDHLDLRTVREERLPEVVGVDAVTRQYAERGHTRGLVTVFGQVTVERIAYESLLNNLVRWPL
jgi:hypothetical protein